MERDKRGRKIVKLGCEGERRRGRKGERNESEEAAVKAESVQTEDALSPGF